MYDGHGEIWERHRHRYEVNVHYRARLEATGLRFSGMSPDGVLPEIVEYPGHPWFIGVQYHPELKSKPFAPHPLFAGFIAASVTQSPPGIESYRFTLRRHHLAAEAKPSFLQKEAKKPLFVRSPPARRRRNESFWRLCTSQTLPFMRGSPKV